MFQHSFMSSFETLGKWLQKCYGDVHAFNITWKKKVLYFCWLLALIIFPESVTWSGKYLSSCYTYVFVKHHVVCGNVLLQCVFPLVYVTFVAWCDNWIMTFVFWMFIRVDGNVEIFQGYKKTVTTIFILFQTIYSIGFHNLGTGRQRRSFCAV